MLSLDDSRPKVGIGFRPEAFEAIAESLTSSTSWK